MLGIWLGEISFWDFMSSRPHNQKASNRTSQDYISHEAYLVVQPNKTSLLTTEVGPRIGSIGSGVIRLVTWSFAGKESQGNTLLSASTSTAALFLEICTPRAITAWEQDKWSLQNQSKVIQVEFKIFNFQPVQNVQTSQLNDSDGKRCSLQKDMAPFLAGVLLSNLSNVLMSMASSHTVAVVPRQNPHSVVLAAPPQNNKFGEFERGKTIFTVYFISFPANGINQGSIQSIHVKVEYRETWCTHIYRIYEWMCFTAREIGAATQPLSHSARVAGAATQPLWVTEWLSGWVAAATNPVDRSARFTTQTYFF